MLGLKRLALPPSLGYRVGYGPDPFTPPDWRFAKPDGTFGGRYDDPRGRTGTLPRERYRALYYAAHPSGAYGETIAQFRPSLQTIAALGSSYLAGRHAAVPRDWRLTRRLGTALLAWSLPLADFEDAATIQALRAELAPIAARLGLGNVDFSAVSGPQREFTQHASLYVYSQVDASGGPRYAGIRYASRLNHAWECWALFEGRFRCDTLRVDTIASDDLRLHAAAAILGLAIEDDQGMLVVPSTTGP